MLKQTKTAETPKTAEAPSFEQIDLKPIRPEVAAPFEHFAGREVGELHNVAGCALRADLVMVRTYRPDPYVLAVKLGDRWYELARVSNGDPALAGLPIIEHPPTPHEVEQQRRKDQADAERIAAEEAYRAERQRVALERRQRAEEHRQRVVAENRLRAGV